MGLCSMKNRAINIYSCLNMQEYSNILHLFICLLMIYNCNKSDIRVYCMVFISDYQLLQGDVYFLPGNWA